MKGVRLLILSLICSHAFGQHKDLSDIKRTIAKYTEKNLQEKIFIHTDRSTYLAGETIWLKLYLREENSNLKNTISKIGYVEILNNEGKAVSQLKLEVDTNGNASGTISLPVTVPTGTYLLRSYTQWMRNYDQHLFFTQSLVIVNPFVPLEAAAKKPSYQVAFFPEGGNMVREITGVVGFEVHGIGDTDVARVSILNDRNDTVAVGQPLRFGLGSFSFTPRENASYHAVLEVNHGHTQSIDLPAIQDSGYALAVSDSIGRLKAKVSRSRALTSADPRVYCLIQGKNLSPLTYTGFLVNGTFEFRVDTSALSPGISRITIFDNALNPVCERVYFKRPALGKILDTDLSTGAARTRKLCTLTVDAVNTNDADLSVSVAKLDATSKQPLNVVAHHYLSSELNGTIASPDYYLESNDLTHQFALNNLLLTHGWSRYKWSEVFTPTTPRFIPEPRGHVMRARLIANDPTKNVKNFQGGYLSVPGKVPQFYTSSSFDNGCLLFETTQFFDHREIVVQPNLSVDSTYRFEILSPFDATATAYQSHQNVSDEVLLNKSTFDQRSLDMQIQHAFAPVEGTTPPLADSTMFFGPADEHYNLDDFTRFPTLEEVMREYVPGVLVRKQKGKFHFLNVDNVSKTIFRMDPLVLLDGVPVFDVDKFMLYDPKKIKSLDVMTRRYYLNSHAFEGVVSFKTYRGDLDGFVVDSRALIQTYEGTQRLKEFYSPRYETAEASESRIPDTRNLLFWAPAIKTNKDGKRLVQFYTSDVTGTYEVVVQGFSQNGQPMYSRKTFKVVTNVGQ